MAALLRRGPDRCRSRQLALTLSCPPTNHLANGSFHSRTFVHGLAHASDFACSAQKACGSSLAFCHSASCSAWLLTWAAFANSAEGGKERVSLRTLVMVEVVGEDMVGTLGSCERRALDLPTDKPGGCQRQGERGRPSKPGNLPRGRCQSCPACRVPRR